MWTAGYYTHILDVGQRPSMSKSVISGNESKEPLFFLWDCVNIMTWWHQSLFWRKGEDFICHFNSKVCSLHLIQPLLISSLQPVCRAQEPTILTIPIEMLSEWHMPLILKILSLPDQALLSFIRIFGPMFITRWCSSTVWGATSISYVALNLSDLS